MRNWVLLVVAVLLFGTAIGAAVPSAGLIKIDGPIGPATADYVSRAVDLAAENQDECLIIQLDTPGGLLDSTKVIIQKFLASAFPPSFMSHRRAPERGARVVSSPWPPTWRPWRRPPASARRIPSNHRRPRRRGKDRRHDEAEAGELRVQLHRDYRRQTQTQRRVGQVVRAKDSAAITAEKALEMNVIDFIAKDLPDLLKQLDGREVNGKNLKTARRQWRKFRCRCAKRFFRIRGGRR